MQEVADTSPAPAAVGGTKSGRTPGVRRIHGVDRLRVALVDRDTLGHALAAGTNHNITKHSAMQAQPGNNHTPRLARFRSPTIHANFRKRWFILLSTAVLSGSRDVVLVHSRVNKRNGIED